MFDRKHLYVLICFLTVSTFFACAAAEYPGSSFVNSSVETYIVWPPPPQTPRIKFLGSIYGPADIGIKRSWVSKVADSIFGKNEIEVSIMRPYGVFAKKGRIYVADPGLGLLHVFDRDRKRHFTISSIKGEPLLSPIGIASDEQEHIYLTDSVLKRALVFDGEGKFIRYVGDPDMFLRPTGIAVDRDRIYVVDTLAHSVFVFGKSDGGFLFKFGGNGSDKGKFHFPTNIFISPDQSLYVTDSLNFRIQVFDRDGNHPIAFGKHGNGSGDFSKPKGIAVDSEGHVYVADADFDMIQIFDSTGQLLLAFGNSGTAYGQMFLPAGIFIDEQDRIYVSDSYNRRVQIFQYLKAENKIAK